MKNREDLSGLTLEELQERLVENQNEYDNLHIQKATHQLSNPIRLRDVRREIARIKTFIHKLETVSEGQTENV